MKRFLPLLIFTVLYSQDLEIYETNRMGLKDITPSIIIEENDGTGDYEVYSVNKFGLKNISPDEIIENDEYNGSWKVYRVNNFGLKNIIPEKIAEEASFNNLISIIFSQPSNLANGSKEPSGLNLFTR